MVLFILESLRKAKLVVREPCSIKNKYFSMKGSGKMTFIMEREQNLIILELVPIKVISKTVKRLVRECLLSRTTLTPVNS